MRDSGWMLRGSEIGQDSNDLRMLSVFRELVGVVDVVLGHVQVLHRFFHHLQLFSRQFHVTEHLIDINLDILGSEALDDLGIRSLRSMLRHLRRSVNVNGVPHGRIRSTIH
mgnify:CR=1 FL=1